MYIYMIYGMCALVSFLYEILLSYFIKDIGKLI